MNYYVTKNTYGTTGVKEVTCGFQPVGMRITVSAKNDLTSSAVQKCVGQTDGTRQSYVSEYINANFKQTKSSNDKMIRHYEDVSGTLTEMVTGTFDSFTATSGKFNLSAASNTYPLIIELWG